MALSHKENDSNNRRRCPNPLVQIIIVGGLGGLAVYFGIRALQDGSLQPYVQPAEPVATLPGFTLATIEAPQTESIPLSDGTMFPTESFTPPTAKEFREMFPVQEPVPDFILTANDETVRRFFESGKTEDGRSVFGLVDEVHRQIKNTPHPLLAEPEFQGALESAGLIPEGASVYDLSVEEYGFKLAAQAYKQNLQQTIDNLPEGDWERERLEDLLANADAYDRLYWTISNVYHGMVLDLYGLFDYYDKSVPGGAAVLVNTAQWQIARDIFQTEGLQTRFLIDTYRQIIKLSPPQRQEQQSFNSFNGELDTVLNSPWETDLNTLLDQVRP